MAAYAALVSLINIIDPIQRHTRLPISLDQKQMNSLHEKASFLIDFLENYNSYGDCDEEMKDLESRISDAAYAAEDIIETHVVDKIVACPRRILKKRENKRMALTRCILPRKQNETISLSTRLLGIEKILENMDFIKEQAIKIKDRRCIDDPQPKRSPVTAHSSSSMHAGKSTMVGFDEELIELMERLSGHPPSRQIIPIVGMGGIGKTTLAKAAYENPLIVQYFDLRFWVSISQEYNLREILLGLLQTKSSQMNEHQLGDVLYKSLLGKRFLVVLDDIWSIESWEIVKSFFPDNRNGSRIVVTTRLLSLATHFSIHSLELKFLDEDKGWNLLSRKVFGYESCPRELEEAGRKIVKNCNGLPLSIVVIGGLLARSKQTKEYWEYVARDTIEIMSLEGNEQCTKILSLSYHNLPVPLKPCFLYMGFFREDQEIRVNLLIKLWVAEGFLKRKGSEELEVTGEKYLQDLVSRNLVLACAHGPGGRIKSCMIHDILRDLSLKEARKDKFMYVPKMHYRDNVKCINNQRRISINQSSSGKEYIPQVLGMMQPGSMCRSLVCDFRGVLPLQNFRLLRVLQEYPPYNRYWKEKYSLDDIFQLVNARCIKINTIVHHRFQASSLCLLWNLQILIITGRYVGPTPSFEIWEMKELRHLEFNCGFCLPDPPTQQMKRQGGVCILENLQTLKRIPEFRCTDEVVKRIPNIRRLNISYSSNFTGVSKQHDLKNLGLLKKLESLNCVFNQQSAGSRFDLLLNLDFPCSLKKLSLTNCRLQWEDMTLIGSLPHLESLKLKSNAFIGSSWVTSEREFCCLKYLEIFRCEDLVHWIVVDRTHFPRLEHLYLEGLCKLVEIPSSIGEIPTLKLIRLDRCRESAAISAKRILEEREELGHEDFQVRVRCYWNTKLQRLASDNFLVQCWR